MMTPERWQQIEDILDEVMPLAAEERAARIGRLCHGNTTLRSEVEEMMGFCEQVQAESFLEAPPHLAAQDLLMGSLLAEPHADHLEAGTVIGPYTVIEQVGRGGMGEVYLAERADPHMRVALKVVKRGMDTNEILQRFRYEREILARLNHPHIAQLYGGGVTDDGRPYFAMEYVEGQTLEAYCDDHQLPIAERLALFKTVCEAVRYAHRNLVVHRDLKPGNILVREGDAGQPLVKLLDFGIAKLIEEDASLHTMPMTQAGALRMTPGYAAPEQVRGQPTTPATDVYALGVILYRLLTGRRPYYFEDRSVTGIESVICLQMPDRPSTVVVRPLPGSGDGVASTTPEDVGRHRAASPAMLRRQLAGDLDAITMMALRKEAGRRYASAAELLDDIERYLDNRPVLAQHDSVAYRTAKFVHRHTVGVGLTAAMVLLITALVTFYTVQLADERDLARQERDRAITMRDLTINMIEMRDPDGLVAPGVELDTAFTHALIQAGLSNMDDLTDPRDQAYMLDVMGQVSLSYNLFGQADSLFGLALQIKKRELRDDDPDLAESVFGLGQVAHNQGRSEHADSLYRWALRLLEKASPEQQRRIPEIQNNLAFVVGRLARRQEDADERQARFEEAKTWYQKASAAEDQLLQANPEDKEVRLLKAGSLRGLATILRRQGHVEEAEARYHETLALLREGFSEIHPEVANIKYGLANLLKSEEDYEGAERYYHEAIEIYRQIYGQQHIAMGNSLYQLAFFYHQSVPEPKLEKADSLYRQAAAVYRAVLPVEDARTTLPLRGLGRLLMERGQPAQAEPFLRQSLPILESNLPKEANTYARVQHRLGVCLTDQGRYREAEAFLQESYAYFRQARDTSRVTTALEALVNLYEAWRKPDQAAAYRAALNALPITTPVP